MARKFVLFVFLWIICPSLAGAANVLQVTSGNGAYPNPMIENGSTTVMYTLTPSAPSGVQEELTANGAIQSYTIQLSDDTTGNEGTILSITMLGSELKFTDQVGAFLVTFDNTNHRVTISTGTASASLLSSVWVTAVFPTVGNKHINLDGTATVSGAGMYTTDTGGHTPVAVMDFHLRGDTNVDAAINVSDDPTSTIPGLFLPLGTVKNCQMSVDPLPSATPAGSSYPRYVTITRDNTNSNVEVLPMRWTNLGRD